MTKKIFFVFVIIAFSLAGCKTNNVKKAASSMLIEQQIAQKIMLDLRYYCPEMTADNETGDALISNDLESYAASAQSKNDGINDVNKVVKQCKTPLIQLPPELAELITSTSLGGMILFADNLVNSEQIIRLTSDLQNAALDSETGLPLFISVDQEGGRVVRLPRNISTSFTGNMAIGATYSKHGTMYAKAVGEVLGSELKALGFNVDHAPDVDVNINANNPVINVRSFGEDPHLVADLGIAMLDGMQSQGIIGTLKHFPGHGDTNTDSHTGLPIVNHDLKTVEQVDLYPFAQAIKQTNVEMIMTAHIQYPALDNSIIVNKNGDSMIKPATLSKKILTNLLRNKMGYQGLVVTDALDMAGISNFFTPLEAVINTFAAGADIALMPMKIRKPSDIKAFKYFIQLLNNRVKEEPLAIAQIQTSVARILRVKKQLSRLKVSTAQVNEKIAQAKNILANNAHKALERDLAQNSIVEIQNGLNSSDWLKNITTIHLLFPQQQQSKLMAEELKQQLLLLGKENISISISNLEDFNLMTLYQQIDNSDLLIVASDSQKTAVELGGIEDLSNKSKAFTNKASFGDKTLEALVYAKQQGKKTILVTLKAPYNLDKFRPLADYILASFDGNFYQKANGTLDGAAFAALAAIITGKIPATGKLPVSI
ncbi:MAG: glycosyl hydrolase family 3 [Gammaproteobacteria bacterium]|nr:MAG: glycosyl hydrolase family 3 [Gammaproteobacteria bacterium]